MVDDGLRVTRRFFHQSEEQMRMLLRKSPDDSWERLLQRVHEKDDFHTYRMRCVTNPARALDTLKPYAELHLTIVCAQNLQPRDTWISSNRADPFVGVFVDDVKLQGPKMETFVVRGTTNPLWQHSMKVGILSPSSMIRLQVYDDQVTDQIACGFVEMCVADIPFDVEIAGWFELRYQDNLKNTAPQRYASHCAIREECVFQATDVEGGSPIRSPRAKKNKQASAKDLKARRQVAQRAMQKTRTLIEGCSQACAKPSRADMQARFELDRGNAGELFVTMKLVSIVSGVDATFALALDAPAPKSFGEYVMEDPDRKNLDLQKCMDSYTEVRLRLFEDFVCCVYYYVRYISSWRSPLLSFIFAAGLAPCVVHTYFLTAVFPSLLAVMLITNAWEDLRRDMTRGGLNAMMNPDGFKRVARWKCTGEMTSYIKRIVENDLQGSVTNMPKLRTLAAACFRDGVPELEFDQLKALLKQQRDIVNFPTEVESTFAPGDKVIVDERRRATVASVLEPEGRVFVVYDDEVYAPGTIAPGVGLSPRALASFTPRSSSMPVGLDPWRVKRRPVAKFYNTWLLPTKLVNTIVDGMEKFDQLEKSAMFPVMEFLTDVFTWRRKCIALFIACVCIAIAVSVVFIELLYEVDLWEFEHGLHHGRDKDIEKTAAWFFISFLRNIDNMIFAVFLIAFFVLDARWFCTIKSLLKIAGRIGRDGRRRAPDGWSFFRQDDTFRRSLESLPSSSWPHLGAISRGVMDRVGNTLDFVKLQKDLANVPSLAHFKTPDLSNLARAAPQASSNLDR